MAVIAWLMLAATACAKVESAAATVVVGGEQAAPGCVTAPEGLRYAWTFDESMAASAGIGRVWQDHVGLFEAADRTGSAIVPIVGKVQGAVAMNGSSFMTDYVELGRDDFTIALWLRPAGLGRGEAFRVEDQTILFHQGKVPGIGLDIRDGQLRLQMFGPNPTQVHLGPRLESGDWQFVSVQVNRDGNSRLMIDGRFIDQRTNFDTSVAFEPQGLPSTAIGGGSPKNQALDEIAIFGRYLADHELESILAAGASGMCR